MLDREEGLMNSEDRLQEGGEQSVWVVFGICGKRQQQRRNKSMDGRRTPEPTLTIGGSQFLEVGCAAYNAPSDSLKIEAVVPTTPRRLMDGLTSAIVGDAMI